jgi:RNA polymerase sigma-70 factor (ECF subfamily)
MQAGRGRFRVIAGLGGGAPDPAGHASGAPPPPEKPAGELAEAPPSHARPRDSDGDVRSAMALLGDEALVVLARREREAGGGNKPASEQLYRRYARFAFNLAVRIAGSTQDAEDTVHDAYLRAFERLGALREPASFRTWLGAIVVREVRTRARRARLLRLLGLGRRSDAVDLDALASSAASPRARAELAQLYALLRTLGIDDRIAWTLRRVEGHDLRTAATLAGCSLATVKRRIERAERYIEEHFVHARAPGAEGQGDDEP